MKNKVMLFSSNGNMIKEIPDDSIKLIGRDIRIGEKGDINSSKYVSFMKNQYVSKQEDMKSLEVYVFDKLIFKGKGSYSDGGGHSLPSITAEIDGEIFLIKIEGSLYKEMTILSDCSL